ncbi:MAG: HAD-IIIA family hydrolase [Synergistaceae bacterium]|jgi:D-glycero-D-manno-heptose 1,7-bisphosphate phosphatase|nr:HAD-IIIA family hydrolase [Synergistaceae bacterium]
MRKAVFLDRDGVINANVYYEKWGEWEAPMSPEDVVIIPGAIEAMLLLQRAGFSLFVISNQGAFAKGKTSLASLMAVIKRVNGLLAEGGVRITESYYSFTHPAGVVEGFSGESLERKPGAYFPRVAAAAYSLDLSGSWMIGDRDTDVLCGKSAGCLTIRIRDARDKISVAATVPYAEASALDEAASIIIGSKKL